MSAEAVPPPRWWERRSYLILLALLTAVPLLWPALPPLTDAPGHLARYHIQLGIGHSPYLARYFGYDWVLIGNLGVDLLVIPLAQIFGLPLAFKLIVLAIPPLTAAGLLLIAREVHGRVPPTAAFALPLAYGFPFQFGFLNYALAMALALLAFALWLRLGRKGRYGLRASLFVVIGALLWLCHAFGWGVLGLLCFSAELIRHRAAGRQRVQAVLRAGVAMAPLAPPILLMLVWRSGAVAGMTGDWFNLPVKLIWLMSALRDRWMLFDVTSVALIILLVVIGLRGSALRMDPTLGCASLLLALAYLCLPRILLGSAYADMRLAPYMLAIMLIGLRPASDRPRPAALMALAAALFLGLRIGANGLSFFWLDREHQRQLAALDHVERGARVMVMAAVPCRSAWFSTRMTHLGSQAIVQRDAFANGLWTMAGAQLVSIRYAAAGRFAADPSQILRPAHCRSPDEPLWRDTLQDFPRDAFDYFWLIGVPRSVWPRESGLVPVWSIDNGVLYRIVHAHAPAPK